MKKIRTSIKKISFIFIILAMIFSMVACSEISEQSPTSKSNNGNLKVHYINVGQGDSILVQQDNENMLIDAGPNSSSEKLVNYLKQNGIKEIKYLVATHPHEDHIGGMNKVINNFKVESVYMPKKIANTKTFKNMVEAMKKNNLKAKTPHVGDKINLGDAKFTILWPNEQEQNNTNNYSIVLKGQYGKNTFLFTGDAEQLVEKSILGNNTDIRAEVLKLGHHGSSTSTSDKFLEKVNPKYAVASCEKGNSYGHPHREIVKKLKDKNIKLYRTDENGDIVLISDGKNIKFNVEPGSYNSGSSSKKK
ncbi:ComEC/Rec2 family competence protein [Clostridium tetani]|uniref:MBL fold metallo-hydrolase n=1 Tax=Clostridium tetani TaxID=1513 RepID=A0ABY0EMP4_CLOTA|nr:ComEC/Rec2 family competence protein [Clostridium tetani]CDI48874.1 competence protein ComE [Clostridium tetani 12124569]KHO39778.1 competence protein ComE [Clostridium tetani]RXI38442.1 MBL fold metallo-hydrolase [Clostridium tetani]RXI54200.1 MBL fold metallo-hydrolase [Clostridium tetani]RXI68862.1 MBL fold metallo-hydrolase [Clostridium tetani]